MTFLAALLLVALILEEFRHQRQLSSLLAAFTAERRSLLDRIQHPELHQIETGEITFTEPPKDTAELAYVGQEVPEFIDVGTPEE